LSSWQSTLFLRSVAQLGLAQFPRRLRASGSQPPRFYAFSSSTPCTPCVKAYIPGSPVFTPHQTTLGASRSRDSRMFVIEYPRGKTSRAPNLWIFRIDAFLTNSCHIPRSNTCQCWQLAKLGVVFPSQRGPFGGSNIITVPAVQLKAQCFLIVYLFILRFHRHFPHSISRIYW
jgi:hypothetical protein